jgi:hypothetical protein
MTNRLLLLFGLIYISDKLFCQSYFEGEIIYANVFESKTQRFTSEQLRMMIGYKQDYFIKGGNYKATTNGFAIEMQLYDDKTNKIYNRVPKSDTLYWFDASLNTDTVVHYEIKSSADTILGYPCSAIILRTRTGVTTLYYTLEYKIDGTKYLNHNYNNWSFFVKKSGSLPLKIVVENDHFRMESIAVEIKSQKL